MKIRLGHLDVECLSFVDREGYTKEGRLPRILVRGLEAQRPQNFCWAGGIMQRTFWLAGAVAILLSTVATCVVAWASAGANWKLATRAAVSATAVMEAILVIAFAPGLGEPLG